MTKEEHEYHAKIVEAITFDRKAISEDLLRECWTYCNAMWLKVVTDAEDTWKYFPKDMIDDAQRTWENRILWAEQELTRRNLVF